MKRFILEMNEDEVTAKTHTTYGSAIKALHNGEATVVTTQVILLNTPLFTMGYRVFVHLDNGNAVEIKLGRNTCIDREIHMGHCLYKLLLAGEIHG